MIPYLNEHMEDNCTSELLGYIRNLVLSRIQVNEEQVNVYGLFKSWCAQQVILFSNAFNYFIKSIFISVIKKLKSKK